MSEVDYSPLTESLPRPADAQLMPPLPPQPKSLRETGLERQLVVELIAKAIFFGGKTHLSVLATRLRLSINVLREVLDFMVGEQLAELAWRGDSDIDVQYQLTGPGKQRASDFLERCAYVGAAPVTLEAYRAMVARQSWRAQEQRIASDDLAAVLGGAHAGPGMLDLLGAALYSGRSLLLYGAPGSGKSTLARQLGQLLHGLVAVPYAVVVGQDIIQLYDAAQHLPPAPQHVSHARQVLERRSTDIRWVLCQRPVIQVGAELDAAMLELRYDSSNGCYHAPPHVRANNGMLIVDDLGRQRVGAADVLTRLMQPLAQGTDPQSLRGGLAISMPVDHALVLATNLPPGELFDAALLRRLGYKVAVGALSDNAYRALFRQQCRVAGIAVDELVLNHLVLQLHGGEGRPLLACYPCELLGRIVDFAGFAGTPPQLTLATLEQAWASLFASCDVPLGSLCESIV
ncbi:MULTISPECIES: ATP-binding protein [unclassified Janthinobacterium]|uniref:ATP-binding protein n=1 Tax=unclassified Janthinobacterium TaxID=2610881 RepID=UPI0016084B39|nr:MULTISPECIES: ATP-binding protein [unclassified Janthinobacterium]MBB5370263.1 energy-coupling factor transporter ATP-binding protein EcfA2 [Janthinobacterium sp. K2C7]MBB5383069.1 energy-coupling factor transporter ATP-binding protein EcfA2 [Janthinobacterium sp. K2Li3]MBB5388452.1 energy-coupling factor transporter ATP-binding protein EcfA2 [Janthinobacterium sp. K2E3]